MSSPIARSSGAPLPAPLELLVLGGAAVFTQLAISRTFGTMVGGASYYTGVLLLGGMFTQGIGLGRPSLVRWVRWTPVAVALPFLMALALSQFNLIAQHQEEFQWTLVANVFPKPANFDLQLAILLLLCSALPLHLLVGSQLGQRQLALGLGARGYLLSSIGAVAGAVLFAGLIQTVPNLASLMMVWLGFLFLAYRITRSSAATPGRAQIGGGLAYGVVLCVAVWVSAQHFWSPYQRIDLKRSRPSRIEVLSNGMYIFTISAAPLADVPEALRTFHRRSFSVITPRSRVLIAGAGAGSADVREALAAGAESVTAVEIDPTFIELGRTFDPDHTYDDPRVTLFNQDARRFLASSRDGFDLVYFPFLDSQTSASSHARFRLDSFLYTVEGMRLAWQRVTPTGHLFVNFCAATPWIQRRIYDTLRQATGRAVQVLHVPSSCWTLYVVSKGAAPSFAPDLYQDVTPIFSASQAGRASTDDWPFLYNQDAVVPMEHARLLAMVAILFLALAGWARPQAVSAIATKPPGRLLWYAAFSGAAFFFLELRAISAMTPLVGADHLAQSAVISAIILASLVGTWVGGLRTRLPLGALWLLLAVTLTVPALVPMSPDTNLGLWGASWLPVLLRLASLVAPTVVAGALYMRMLRDLDSTGVVAMQRVNLIGGALGGLTEVLVVVTGFERSLAIAALLYALAGLPLLWPLIRRPVAIVPAPTPS